MPSQYRLRRRVQFYETDAAGIVHFSCFFRYMEEAEHALWREAGLEIFSPGERIGWPRVSASFEFRRPLRVAEEFDVWIRVTAITPRRMHYSCVLQRGDEQIAEGSLAIACVSKQPGEPMKAIDIPAAIAARFQVAAPVDL